jgi:hypothetical protein
MARFSIWLAVLLISICLVQGTKAAQDAKGDGQFILVRLGDISDGHCRCKDQWVPSEGWLELKIEGGVVSGVINLESPGVRAPGWRPRHDKRYHEA